MACAQLGRTATLFLEIYGHSSDQPHHRKNSQTTFSRLNAARQHTFGPSWSVRPMAAPRSVGPAVYSGLPPTLTTLWSLLECAAPWPLLAVWDPRFARAHRQPPPLFWSLLECAAPWPLLAVWDPRFSWTHCQTPQHKTHRNSTPRNVLIHITYSCAPRQAPTHTSTKPFVLLVTPFILNSKTFCRLISTSATKLSAMWFPHVDGRVGPLGALFG